MADTPEFHFRRRYNLAPHDPRFLECNIEEILVDIWAHRFHDHPRERETVVTANFDEEFEALEAQALAAAQAAATTTNDEPLPDDFEPVIEEQF